MGRILLVRHGQASFGADDYDVLSELGWEQGRALGRRLAADGCDPTYVVRGGLRRHRETLEAILDGAGWVDRWGGGTDEVVGADPGIDQHDEPGDGPRDGAGARVRVDPDWDEFDHVALVAGFPDLPPGPLDRRAFQAVFERATARWTAGEGDAAETYAGFLARVRGALTRATAAAGPGVTVLVVTSGGVIAAACAMLLDPDGDDPAVLARLWSQLNTVTANTSLTTIVVGATGARLLTFNDHGHATGGLLTYR